MVYASSPPRVEEESFLFPSYKINSAHKYTNTISKTASRIWSVTLASLAALDFGAAMARRHSFAAFTGKNANSKDRDSDQNSSLLLVIHSFLYHYANTLGMLFALAWFLDAFVDAQHQRTKAARQYDQKQLLSKHHHLKESKGNVTRRTNRNATINTNNPRYKQKHGHDNWNKGKNRRKAEREQDDNLWWKGFRGVYIRTVVLQILLLPVGFFVTVCHYGGWAVGGDNVTQYHSANRWQSWLSSPSSRYYSTSSATIDCYSDQNAKCFNDDNVGSHDNFDNDYSVFSSDAASVSLLFVVFKVFALTVARRTGNQMRYQTITKAKKVAYRMAIRGLHHPLRFNRRLRRLLSVVRWIQYLLPLVGTFNKLKGNVENLWSKYQQRREANHAKAIRQRLWGELTIDELREYCAIVIQSFFRRQYARKKAHILRVWKGNVETIAALKIQRAARSSKSRARLRQQEQWELLHTLQEKDWASRHRQYQFHGQAGNNTITPTTSSASSSPSDNGIMSADERRRMYVLQAELESEAQSWINERLLLRPNTYFAVIWKVLFVFAVLIEISTLAVQPIVARHKDPVTGHALDLEAYLDNKLIPTPVFRLEQCSGQRPATHFNISRPTKWIQRFGDNLRDRLLLWQDRAQSSNETYIRPWYCNGTYSRLQAVYIIMADLAVHHFFTILSIICFVDVYIEFFTGQYEKKSGRLVPPAFFARWVFPGLLLQLMVNPELDVVSEMVTHSLAGLMFHGPIRIFRWTVAFFYPLFLYLVRLVKGVWYTAACRQNSQLQEQQQPSFLGSSFLRFSSSDGVSPSKILSQALYGWNGLSSLSPTSLHAKLEKKATIANDFDVVSLSNVSDPSVFASATSTISW